MTTTTMKFYTEGVLLRYTPERWSCRQPPPV